MKSSTFNFLVYLSQTRCFRNNNNSPDLDFNKVVGIVSESFYFYTTTGLFETGNDEINNESVIKSTQLYVEESYEKSRKRNEPYQYEHFDLEPRNKNWPKKDESMYQYSKDPNRTNKDVNKINFLNDGTYQSLKDSDGQCSYFNNKSILSYLCSNIIEGLGAINYQHNYDSMEDFFYTSFVFGTVFNPSGQFLQEYLVYKEKKRRENTSFLKWLSDLFWKILKFLFGSRKDNKNDESLELKDICDFKKELRSKANTENICDEVASFIDEIGRMLLNVEVRQAVLPEYLEIHEKLRNELGMLLAAVKLMNFDDLKSSKHSNLLNFDVERFITENKHRLEKLKNSKSRNKQEVIDDFMIVNKYGISDWIEKSFKSQAVDKISKLEEYIYYLNKSIDEPIDELI